MHIASPQFKPLLELFFTFFKLGCSAFGGPVAHIGYFQHEFVERRRWLDASAFADLVALCQFLPGPASSQVGFAIGLRKAGVTGAFAAWLGFTLPSAVLMILVAYGVVHSSGSGDMDWVVGLKIAAVAVVAHALWSMSLQLCPDRRRKTVAVFTALLLLLINRPWVPMVAVILGLLWGLKFHSVEKVAFDGSDAHASRWLHQQRRLAGALPYLLGFGILLVGLPLLAKIFAANWLQTAAAFYRAGALVFGGGHVVLPLLDAYTVKTGWVEAETFLAGYGAAQALPGPLFAFSAFLGTSFMGTLNWGMGLWCLVWIYVPSWLLVLGVMPYWERLRASRPARGALAGANAVVVGLLLAAFYEPIWVSSIQSSRHMAFALGAFLLLKCWKCPAWLVVIICAVIGSFLF
jgi:chromate transporter